MKLNIDNVQSFVDKKALSAKIAQVEAIRSNLLEHTGKGSDNLGWLNLPGHVTPQLDAFDQIAKEVGRCNAAFLCVGIGGSYLGAKTVIEALAPDADVYFVGHHMHPDAFRRVMDKLEKRDVYVNVISKSGTTLEPAAAFRVIRPWMEKKLRDGTSRQIIATTDKLEGALRKLAGDKGYRTFIIPDDIGGRFSIFTPVGLLPMRVAGVDTRALVAGAKEMQEALYGSEGRENDAVVYAAVRNLLHENGKKIEILANWHPDLTWLGEWWKQLFGESEGKQGKGIFPASVTYSTDLHSMGQYIQDGERHLFETNVYVENAQNKVAIPEDEDNLDGLNYITKFDLNQINEKAYEGTAKAHTAGGVPNMTISLEQLDAHARQ
jgi:glucose-6-phosphate isomerase